MEPTDKSVPEDNKTKPEMKGNQGFVTDRLTNVGASTENDNVKITNLYICSLIISPVLHIMDVGSDSYLAYQYYQNENTFNYFLLTVTFIIFPAAITTVFSIRMYVWDEEPASYRKWILRCVLLALQIAPVVRYFEALQHALRLRNDKNSPAENKKHSKSLLKEDSNLALLRIVECFLEAAPQQVLQIAILLHQKRKQSENTESVNLWQIYLYWSVVTSLMSTAWTFAMYHRSIRFVQKNKMRISWAGSLIQFGWIFFVTTSRILSISEVASVNPTGTVIACLVHWFIMTMWLSMFEQTWFCYPADDTSRTLNRIKEILFYAVMGLVYIFSYLSLNDSPTRYKYVFYYSLCFAENSFAILVWSLWDNKGLWWFSLLSVVTLVMFVLGIVLMLIYYSYYHPSMGLCYEAEIGSLEQLRSSTAVRDKLYELNELSQMFPVGTQTE